jgi:menaquinone-specific isochorismate synthase
MALAGSIRRGNTPEEDKTYADELLNSPKDQYEHQVVIDGIKQRLEPLAEQVAIGATGIISLSNIQHIYTSESLPAFGARPPWARPSPLSADSARSPPR